MCTVRSISGTGARLAHRSALAKRHQKSKEREVSTMPYRKVRWWEQCWYAIKYKLLQVFRMKKLPRITAIYIDGVLNNNWTYNRYTGALKFAEMRVIYKKKRKPK